MNYSRLGGSPYRSPGRSPAVSRSSVLADYGLSSSRTPGSSRSMAMSASQRMDFSPIDTSADISSSGMKQQNLRSAVDESNAVGSLLKKRLLEKTRYEAVLVQGLQSARATEGVLRQQLNDEIKFREQLQRQIKDLDGSVERLKGQTDEKGRKEVAQIKQINALEMKIKDLMTSLETTTERERRAQQQVVEAHRKSRELERELMDLRMQNQRLQVTSLPSAPPPPCSPSAAASPPYPPRHRTRPCGHPCACPPTWLGNPPTTASRARRRASTTKRCRRTASRRNWRTPKTRSCGNSSSHRSRTLQSIRTWMDSSRPWRR